MFKKLVLVSVALIPKGSVSTYGDIAGSIGNPGLARAVGNALHGNPYPKKVPCHRVVHSDGSLARNFAFGGKKRQMEMLEKEGVPFMGNGKVDMKRAQRHFYKPFIAKMHI
jgi:methylated-DNA-protein-cysteine methyltransferase-like protein